VVDRVDESRLQVQLRGQAIATETPGRPRVGNLQCVREIGAPAVMSWIAGHGRVALRAECVYGRPSV
jgi:hypothetical protein